MHNLVGQSSWFDRSRKVYLGNSIELEVTQEWALILIGPPDPDAPKERIIFSRPGIVAAMMILAQVIEEQGQLQASTPPVEILRLRTRWITCPGCDGQGGRENNYGTWHECELCEGAGTCVAT